MSWKTATPFPLFSLFLFSIYCSLYCCLVFYSPVWLLPTTSFCVTFFLFCVCVCLFFFLVFYSIFKKTVQSAIGHALVTATTLSSLFLSCSLFEFRIASWMYSLTSRQLPPTPSLSNENKQKKYEWFMHHYYISPFSLVFCLFVLFVCFFPGGMHLIVSSLSVGQGHPKIRIRRNMRGKCDIKVEFP